MTLPTDGQSFLLSSMNPMCYANFAFSPRYIMQPSYTTESLTSGRNLESGMLMNVGWLSLTSRIFTITSIVASSLEVSVTRTKKRNVDEKIFYSKMYQSMNVIEVIANEYLSVNNSSICDPCRSSINALNSKEVCISWCLQDWKCELVIFSIWCCHCSNKASYIVTIKQNNAS